MMLTHAHTVATHTRCAHAPASRDAPNVQSHSAARTIDSANTYQLVCAHTFWHRHIHAHIFFFSPQQVKETEQFQAEMLFANWCVCLTLLEVPGGWGLQNSTILTSKHAAMSELKFRFYMGTEVISNVHFQEKNYLQKAYI